MARPPSAHVERLRPAGPRRGGLIPTLAVVGALVAVAGVAVVGREQAVGQERVAAAGLGAQIVRPVATNAPAATPLPILAIRAEQPRVVLPRVLVPHPGPDGVADGPAGTSRLRVLSWQADPYES